MKLDPRKHFLYRNCDAHQNIYYHRNNLNLVMLIRPSINRKLLVPETAKILILLLFIPGSIHATPARLPPDFYTTHPAHLNYFDKIS